MNLQDVKTLDEAQYYVEGIINDFELGISTKEETLGYLGQYTAHLMDLFGKNVIANPSLLGLYSYEDIMLGANNLKIKINQNKQNTNTKFTPHNANAVAEYNEGLKNFTPNN